MTGSRTRGRSPASWSPEMAEWTWGRSESPAHAMECYEVRRGGLPVITLTVKGSIPQPSLVLGALCDALAGPAAVKPETPLGAPAGAEDEKLSDKQRAKIHIGLAEYKPEYREQAARHAALTQIVGRPITSTNDLTKAEASMVIDRIEAAKARVKRGAA